MNSRFSVPIRGSFSSVVRGGAVLGAGDLMVGGTGAAKETGRCGLCQQVRRPRARCADGCDDAAITAPIDSPARVSRTTGLRVERGALCVKVAKSHFLVLRSSWRADLA